MKIKNRWNSRALAAALALALLLAGCQAGPGPDSQSGQEKPGPGGAAPPSATPTSPPVEAKPALRVLQQLDGVSYGSGSEEGFYSICIDSRPNDSTNLLYLDYASHRQVALCSNPNCSHMDESCTSWVAHAGDGVFPLYAGEYLYLIFKGSEQQGEPACIQKLGRDGSDAAPLITLEPSETLVKPYVTDEKYLYCNKIAVSAQRQVLRSIVKIDLESGAQTELYPATEGMIPSILGAGDGHLIVEEFGDMTNPAAMECTLYTLSTEGALSGPVAAWNTGRMVRWVAGGTIYLLEKGQATLQCVDAVSGEQRQIELEPLKQAGVNQGSVRFVQGVSDLVSLSYEMENEPGRPHWLLACPSSGQTTGFELAYPTAGGLQHMYIVAELEDRYLISVGEEAVQQYAVGADGTPGQLSGIVSQWALIRKEDYWNSKSDYTAIELFSFE